jgi:hypothetical protein
VSTAELETKAPSVVEPAEQSVYEQAPSGQRVPAQSGESFAESYARAQLIEAQAEAVRAKNAAEIAVLNGKAAAQARREELALKRAEAKHEAELARIKAQTEREQDALAAERAERAREEAARELEEQHKTEQDQVRAVKARKWRKSAIAFAIVCGIVSLPVQMHAFYSQSEPWLLAAPLVLEGGAWVVLRGADAAVAEGRPHWHYRLIAWLIAALAATVNITHGLARFGIATAGATGFASLAGPGVWDLHEHGVIRQREGHLTWRQRKKKEAEEKKAAAARAAQEKREQAEREAAEKRAEQERRDAEQARRAEYDRVAAARSEKYPDEWAHALEVAAAIGSTEVTDEVWRRAWHELHFAEPGITVDVIRSRNAAARRMSHALAEGAAHTPEQTAKKPASSQVAPQMPPKPKRPRSAGPTVRATRRKGDSPKFHPAASLAMRQTALENASSE